MVKLTVDVPERMFKAVTLLSETFKVPVEEIVVDAIESDIRGSLSTNLSDYAEPLTERIKELLEKVSEDTCQACIVEDKGRDPECGGCPERPSASP